MRLATRASHLLEKQFGLTLRGVRTTELLGRRVALVRGTRRLRADYDDAWNVALALHSHRVFDVGSNVGWTALLMLLAADLDGIVLFDANPLALSIAAENLIRNGFSWKARFFPGLLSDKEGEKMMFYTVGIGAAGSIYPTHAATASSLGAGIEMQAMTLDRAVQVLGIVPDFVKVDVEGAEARVLDGFTATAREVPVKILVEVHSPPPVTLEQNAAQMLAWCARMGYEAWYLKEHCELTDPQQVAKRGRCHLLLQRAGTGLPDYMTGIDQGDDCAVALRVCGRMVSSTS
jgi:FkbM family methyltransferase